MARERSKDASAGGGGSEISETIDLLKRYVLQETVGPLKRIGQILGYGLGGSLALTVGCILLVVAVLRALEEETGNTFAGTWSFAPYLIAGVFAILLLVLAVIAATRKRSGGSAASS